MKRKIFMFVTLLAVAVLSLGTLTACDEPPAPPVSVEGVEFETAVINLDRDGTHTLIYTVFPEDADNKAISFSSANSQIVLVSESGVLTAKVAGSAKITITTEDGNKTAECTVNVAPPAGYSLYSNSYISLVYPSTYLKQESGEDAQFQAGLVQTTPNFTVITEDKNNIMETTTMEEYKTMLEQMYAVLKITATVSLPVRSTVTFNDISCTKITMATTISGVTINQEQYIIQTSTKTVNITFTLSASDSRNFIDVVLGELLLV